MDLRTFPAEVGLFIDHKRQVDVDCPRPLRIGAVRDTRLPLARKRLESVGAQQRSSQRQPGRSVAMGTSAKGRKWSQRVTEKSDALDLEDRVFTWKDPRRIARSLKRSAERSTRRKGTPLQSAMSMLNFYINRAGKDLDASQRKVLNEAKDELRSLFNKKTA